MTTLAPIVIVLGVVPELEAALYVTVVVLILLGAGWILLGLVFAQRRPASASSGLIRRWRRGPG